MEIICGENVREHVPGNRRHSSGYFLCRSEQVLIDRTIYLEYSILKDSLISIGMKLLVLLPNMFKGV